MSKGPASSNRPATPLPVQQAFDLLGRRWALRIVWELHAEPLTFRQLQSVCGGVSPSVLQRRLHELREAGVVEQVPRLGYRLSIAGERLFPILARLKEWADDIEPLARK